MQNAQDTRYQGTLSCLISVRKRRKRCIPGSAAFEDIPALSLPRAACCPLARAGISCHSPLHTPDCAVTVALLFPQHCTSAHLQQKPLQHLCTSLSHACGTVPSLKPGLAKQMLFFFFLHYRIPKQSEFHQATGETAGSHLLRL